MLEVEKQRAKEKKNEAGKENLQNLSPGNISNSGEGVARDKAAEKVDANVSGRDSRRT
jgi:hypothetical protein